MIGMYTLSLTIMIGIYTISLTIMICITITNYYDWCVYTITYYFDWFVYTVTYYYDWCVYTITYYYDWYIYNITYYHDWCVSLSLTIMIGIIHLHVLYTITLCNTSHCTFTIHHPTPHHQLVRKTGIFIILPPPAIYPTTATGFAHILSIL